MRPEHEETFDDFRMSMLLNSSALALRPPFALEVEQHIGTILTSEPLYGVLASFDDHLFFCSRRSAQDLKQNCKTICPLPFFAMAMRSRLPAVALCLVAFVALQNAFVAAPRQSSAALRGVLPVTAGVVGALPQMANAMDMDTMDVDMGSSLNMSATIEALMLGIVLGTVPITVLGLFVSAWLQFKKGPTLGI